MWCGPRLTLCSLLFVQPTTDTAIAVNRTPQPADMLEPGLAELLKFDRG
jgi:hypothetical protein